MWRDLFSEFYGIFLPALENCSSSGSLRPGTKAFTCEK